MEEDDHLISDVITSDIAFCRTAEAIPFQFKHLSVKNIYKEEEYFQFMDLLKQSQKKSWNITNSGYIYEILIELPL